MWDFIAQRAKAVAGLLVPVATTVVLDTVEKSTGMTIPDDWKVGIVSIVTGVFVHQVPNKKP